MSSLLGYFLGLFSGGLVLLASLRISNPIAPVDLGIDFSGVMGAADALAFTSAVSLFQTASGVYPSPPMPRFPQRSKGAKE